MLSSLNKPLVITYHGAQFEIDASGNTRRLDLHNLKGPSTKFEELIIENQLKTKIKSV